MKLFINILALLSLLTNLQSAAWVDPVIKQKIINRSDETISVIVLLKELPSLTDRLSVESRLKSFGSNFLSKNTNQEGSVLWNVNGLHLYLRMDQVLLLAERSEVHSIIYDAEINLELPKVEETQESLRNIAWGITQINADKVWNTLGITGRNVKVGILDTGYSDHPALKDRVIADRTFNFGAKTGPNDRHGHGTHCAGTIGGSTVNGKVIGVATGVSFIIGGIFNSKGKGSLSLMLQGMQWIADPDGDSATADYPALVSNSWGINWTKPKQVEPLLRAVQTWTQLGIVPVFAAGNSGPYAQTIIVPGSFNESITIGSTDKLDRIARFSSQGPGSYLGIQSQKPDISAPGVSVYSADLGGKYTYRSGTSMATPHVAGVIALMLEANPNLSIEQIRQILHKSSVDLGDNGYDYAYGWGRLDAYAAVLEAQNLLN